MDVTPLVRQGQKIIQSYSNGVFKVNGTRFDHAVIVHPDDCFGWDIADRNFNGLIVSDFQYFIDNTDAYDVFLLGCGDEMAFLKPTLKKELHAQGVNVDVMGTGAACRTYNVLMAEGRRIACALFPVSA